MPARFPPQVSRNAKLAIGIVLVATLAYSVVIAGQILLWFVIVGIAAGIYVTWALVVAVYRMVEAVERVADAMEERNRRAADATDGAGPDRDTETADADGSEWT